MTSSKGELFNSYVWGVIKVYSECLNLKTIRVEDIGVNPLWNTLPPVWTRSSHHSCYCLKQFWKSPFMSFCGCLSILNWSIIWQFLMSPTLFAKSAPVWLLALSYSQNDHERWQFWINSGYWGFCDNAMKHIKKEDYCVSDWDRDMSSWPSWILVWGRRSRERCSGKPPNVANGRVISKHAYWALTSWEAWDKWPADSDDHSDRGNDMNTNNSNGVFLVVLTVCLDLLC